MKAPCRSKSVSGCPQVDASRRPSSGSRQGPSAESTKITTQIRPSRMTPVVKLPLTTTGKLKPTNNQLVPPETLTVSSRKSTSCGCSQRRANSTSETIRSTSSRRSFQDQAASSQNHDDVFAQPLSSTKYPIRTSSQSREFASSSAQLRLSQMQLDGSKISKAKSTEILTSTRQTPSPAPKSGCCIALSSKSAKPDLRLTLDRQAGQSSCSLRNQPFVTLTHDSGYSNVSSAASITPYYSASGTTVEERYLTLPEEQFITLSQDTLKTTRYSVEPTLNNIRFIRDSSLLDEIETPFVDARDFFHDIDSGITSTVKTIPIRSPLELNVPPRRSNSISDTSRGEVVKKPAVKMTLKKRNSMKQQASFPLLYSPEYSNDLIMYCYNHRRNFLVKSEWVQTYVDKRARSNTVNWLLQVWEFIAPEFEPVYYMSIRIFDFSIIALKLRHGHYQLAAVVAFWLALKYLGNAVQFKISKIFSLCNGKYSTREIRSMETKILKATGFCLNIPDPLDFLYNYLKSSNLENDEVLKYGGEFVLECATLFETYAIIEAPIIAASSLYMAYQILRSSKEVHINFIWYDKNMIHHYAEKILRVSVKYAILEKYEPFNKYERSEKMHVAKRFLNI